VHDHDIYCMRSYKYHPFSRKICQRPAGLHCIFPCGAFVTRNRGEGLPLKLVSYRAKLREIEINRQFDRMVVVTHYMRDELLRNKFEPTKIEIHPPVPRMGDPGMMSNFSSRNLIIYAGQIIRGKGVDVLLESLALLKVPFECLILGDGSHREYCEKLSAKLNLTDRVRFAGFIPQVEMKNHFRECSVFVISSVWPEPFATVGMEVMRYGIPVVAFDVGGIRDWLKHGGNGYLVPWMDRRQYADRIEHLLRHKTVAQAMGQQGRKLVNTHYDFGRYISEIEELFQRVASEKRCLSPAPACV
jgi:glycosyltransferase involved in cell wall biosynthesis